jgi:hypothetical protein
MQQVQQVQQVQRHGRFWTWACRGRRRLPTGASARRASGRHACGTLRGERPAGRPAIAPPSSRHRPITLYAVPARREAFGTLNFDPAKGRVDNGLDEALHRSGVSLPAYSCRPVRHWASVR